LFRFQLSHGSGRESQGDPAGCLLSHRLHVLREKGEQGAGRVWHAVKASSSTTISEKSNEEEEILYTVESFGLVAKSELAFYRLKFFQYSPLLILRDVLEACFLIDYTFSRRVCTRKSELPFYMLVCFLRIDRIDAKMLLCVVYDEQDNFLNLCFMFPSGVSKSSQLNLVLHTQAYVRYPDVSSDFIQKSF